MVLTGSFREWMNAILSYSATSSPPFWNTGFLLASFVHEHGTWSFMQLTIFVHDGSLPANERVKLKANRDAIWHVLTLSLLTKHFCNCPDIGKSIGFRTLIDAFVGYQVSAVITAQKECSQDWE
jgi:hypothetical protein